MSHRLQASDINHHLFADNTQLCISFKPGNFNEVMPSLADAFHSIPNWMSANLLVLNPTKTEFLLIGGPQHFPQFTRHSLPLISDISLTPVHFARNLDFRIDSNLS